MNPIASEVVILGSGTGVPFPGRSYAGILVRAGGRIALLDTGPGTLTRLLKVGVTYLDIDYIFYTHFHPDHSLDLVSILFAAKYHLEPRRKPLRIFGPVGLKDFYCNLENLYGSSVKPRDYELSLRELGDAEVVLDGWKIRTKPMTHMVTAIGYSIEFPGGKKLVYSGDTDYCENIVRLASGADLLVLECSFPDDKRVDGHLNPSLCARIGVESGCKQMVLTHFYPPCKASLVEEVCGKIYKGLLVVAKDYSRFEI